MESDEYIRVSEAVKRSGIPRTTLYSAIATGTLPHAMQLGLMVVRMSDVLRYKETVKPGNPQPGPRRAKPSPIPETTSGSGDNDHSTDDTGPEHGQSGP